ncbi:hypothetical protein VTJ49DRAFT_3676 [Mycothermus thermophilus]|uniref:Uncharacterized protein n=1 Tax=Humicola insolens TaxID=85995 RepID=A0ABR3V715_HUMIN
MCLIGLLLPLEPKNEPKKKRRHSHRRSRRSSTPRSPRPREPDKDKPIDSKARAEDALANLCLTLQQSLLEERQQWRDQDRRDIIQEERRRLATGMRYSEAAPPYPVDDNDHSTMPHPPPLEVRSQAGVAESPGCSREHRDAASSSSTECCRKCVCSRCGFEVTKCPAVSEVPGKTPDRGAESPVST